MSNFLNRDCKKNFFASFIFYPIEHIESCFERWQFICLAPIEVQSKRIYYFADNAATKIEDIYLEYFWKEEWESTTRGNTGTWDLTQSTVILYREMCSGAGHIEILRCKFYATCIFKHSDWLKILISQSKCLKNGKA